MVLRLLLICLVLVAPVYAQTTEYTFAPESSVYVDGTSNSTPEWRVYATEIEGGITVNTDDPSAVQSVQLVVPARMMKSRKSPIMDRGMHDALQVKDHPNISYELTSTADLAMTSDTTFTLSATGNLTIGPQTNEVTFPVEGTLKPDGSVHFKGSYALLMTDYGLKPPSLMFGSLRTGNEVVVTAELIASPAN